MELNVGRGGVSAVDRSPELMGLSAALEGLREELESTWEKRCGQGYPVPRRRGDTHPRSGGPAGCPGWREDPLVAHRGRRRCHSGQGNYPDAGTEADTGPVRRAGQSPPSRRRGRPAAARGVSRL